MLLIILCDLYAEFGPLYRTTDAEEIKMKIADIKPDGGGDTPEMSLSGLQVLTIKNNIVRFMVTPLNKQTKKHNKLTKFVFLAVGSHWCSQVF